MFCWELLGPAIHWPTTPPQDSSMWDGTEPVAIPAESAREWPEEPVGN